MAGETQTIVGGINDSGQVVGAFRDSAGVQHAYVTDRRGGFVTIDFPGATATLGEGINNRGDIVGTYRDAQNTQHGFLLSSGTFTAIDFPDPNAILNFAADINDHGEIAGIYNTSDGSIHGYTLKRNGFTSIDVGPPFPITITQAFSINDRTQVAGDFDDVDGNLHGFIFLSGNVQQQVDVPGEQDSGATGLNNSGDVVGSVLDENFVQHGFLETKGNFFIVDFPGASATAPSHLNNKGIIVGRYTDQTGIHSFMAVPGVQGNSAAVPNPGPPLHQTTRICGSREWRNHPEDIKDPQSCVAQ
ncbi:MAG TPA: hypothetical protein VFP59_12390 [Candidatus Angelobacter sp.]|nr:hypothetical protein [Candidatus Angelobacter sp.]